MLIIIICLFNELFSRNNSFENKIKRRNKEILDFLGLKEKDIVEEVFL